MIANKKKTQLGMHPGTASYKLVKDVLYKLIVETNKNKCFRCNEDMTRDTFSIEHKIPWLDSENPIETFFDLNNISFSHLTCNTSAARTNKKYHTKEDLKAAKSKQTQEWKLRANYIRTPESRKLEYERRKLKTTQI